MSITRLATSTSNAVLSRSRLAVFSANRRLKRFEPVIWLIGDGRSGTTWAASLINHSGRMRELFEPFHPRFVGRMRFLQPHQYLHADTPHARLERTCAQVFSGGFSAPRIDADNHRLLYRGLLVKDIFGNLMAHWVARRFPDLRIVLLLRNPFEVALSKQAKPDWYWFNDPLALLAQPALRDDFLKPHETMIREVAGRGDFVLNQILIWCVINSIPLRQFDPTQLSVCFYEDLLDQPERLPALLEHCHAEDIHIPEARRDRQSKVSDAGLSAARARHREAAWMTGLPTSTYDLGQDILRAFGLAEFYDDGVRRIDALARFRARHRTGARSCH